MNLFFKARPVTLLIVLFFSVSAYSQDIFKNEEQKNAAFREILPDELKEIYSRIDVPEEKARWENKYWKLMDPTPTTEHNEFYEEFLKRFSHARKYFSNIMKPLYLDDRGIYYLRYGQPDERVTSAGVGKAYNDNETWAYYRLNLFIDFVDKLGFGYREVPSLLDAVKSGPLNQKAVIAASLYSEREALHQKYMDFRDVTSARAGGEAQTMFMKHSGQLDAEKKIVLESIPPAEFDFEYGMKQLDARMASCIFRGDSGRSRMELYYALPLNQLGFQDGSQFPYETIVDKQLTLMDEDFEIKLKNRESLMLAARNEQEIEKRIYINQHNEKIAPGFYNLALQLKNDPGQRLAILRAQVNIKDFTGDSLMLSDIQLAAQIREGIERRRNLKANNLLVVPHLGHIINKSRPINIYFEIYNLSLNNTGQARYQVAYEVHSVIQDKTVWMSMVEFISRIVGGDAQTKETIGSSFETAGVGEFQQIYLSIDFSKFPAGPSRLVVKVNDLESGERVTGEKRFILK